MMKNFKKIFMAILFTFLTVSSISGTGLSVNGTEMNLMGANLLEKSFCIPPEQINDSILYRMLVYYQVKKPRIVLAQAKLETGYYKSNLCVNYYNLFGIKLNGKYAHFKSFDEAILAYRDKVQYKWREGKEDYYVFLNRIEYASIKNYTKKVKILEKNLMI